MNLRKTTQALMPARPAPAAPGDYEIYPAYPLPAGQIELGYDALAARLAGHTSATIDGFGGVQWANLREQLGAALAARGMRVAWRDAADALLPPEQIERLVAPFLGGDDPLFGTRFTGALADFFDPAALGALAPDPQADISIVYGCGAALAVWPGPLAYADVPKNEIQFRARAGAALNLGARAADTPKRHYKRCYFVDWPALGAHKAALLPRIDLIIDEQRPDQPALMSGDALREGLRAISQSYVRPRPWFEPGPWGGQWLKRAIPQLPQDAVNIAWSFELIAPENGICFASDDTLLEVSFDTLMFAHARDLLGDYAEHFGAEFPIRFDFLDTIAGGNLSLQCHPRPGYIRQHFGERFTQDETYYILECAPDATVYLGFQPGVQLAVLRAALERSEQQATPLDVERFVQVLPARKHDLFLIPSGTIHCSGAGNLVLEISATPYIFTFKMYDWLRLDLDGRPRPLNIDRALANLRFDRQGARVAAELVSQPRVVEAGDGWQVVHVPTHPEHFYDVRRYEFDTQVRCDTAGSPHVLMLVEGQAVDLTTASGARARFGYAETFVVPAAAGSYTLSNAGPGRAKVVQAFLKPGWAGFEM